MSTFLVVGGAILLGLLLFAVFGKIYTALFDDSEYQRLQSEISTAQMQRRAGRIPILLKIGAPECPDGTYSPRQLALWEEYKRLEAANEATTKAEQEALVRARRG